MSATDDRRPNPRIVVIDDDHAVLHSMCFALRSEGFEVVTYDNGPAFLAAAEPAAPDCAIVDQDMGGMTGLDVARALRERGSTLPLIMVSGAVTPSLKNRALAAGFRAVLEKPLFGDELGDAVAEALSDS
ncbi:MAG: response regulator [Pseudaminobacter sp.]